MILFPLPYLFEYFKHRTNLLLRTTVDYVVFNVNTSHFGLVHFTYAPVKENLALYQIGGAGRLEYIHLHSILDKMSILCYIKRYVLKILIRSL